MGPGLGVLMSRLDRKAGGRFTPDYEVRDFGDALLSYQGVNGDFMEYYRFSRDATEHHPIYNEPTGNGRWFIGPQRVPVLNFVREEGMPNQMPGGMYWTDSAWFSVPFAGLVRAGMGRVDIEHGNYVRDRLVYDDRVFRVVRIQVHGQVQRRDLMVVITVNQLKSEDLVGDAQFSAWRRREHAIERPES